MGKNGYWLMLDDKYKSFDEYIEKIKADERTKVIEEIWIDAINNFDDILNLEELDDLLKAHK